MRTLEEEEKRTIKPEWARQALIEHAVFMLSSIRSKSGKGRKARAMEEQQQIWDDFLVFGGVNYWREQRRRTRAGRSQQFSWRQAFIRTGKEYKLSPGATRTAYKRAERRNKEGFYYSELFDRTSSRSDPSTQKCFEKYLLVGISFGFPSLNNDLR